MTFQVSLVHIKKKERILKIYFLSIEDEELEMVEINNIDVKSFIVQKAMTRYIESAFFDEQDLIKINGIKKIK